MTKPYEKHSTSTDALDTLGSIIDENEKRDAIHLAVEPAVAAGRLAPGQHVSFDPATSRASLALTGEGVGIVDPFLERAVEDGERFWLVVYPREINSLRHVWEHSAFAPSRDLSGQADPHAVSTVVSQSEAEQWLRRYLLDEFGIDDTGGTWGDVSTFDSVMDRISEDDDYVYIYGTDAHGEVPDEFVRMAEIYLDKKLDSSLSFSCSC